MNQKYQEQLSEVIWSIHRALWGAVIPSLRQVRLKWGPEDKKAMIKFYHHGEITSEIEWHYSCIHVEVHADFIDDPETDYEVIRCDYPNPLPQQGHAIYMRKEPPVAPIKPKEYAPQDLEVIDAIETAIYRTLLGEIIPSMRSIILIWESGDEKAMIRFYHEGEITEAIKTHYASIMEEMDLNFSGISVTCTYKIIRCDPPEYIPINGNYVIYLRGEFFKEGDCISTQTIYPSLDHVYWRVLSDLDVSIHRALWGEVIPPLRTVMLTWEPGDTKAIIQFFHDGEVIDKINTHYASLFKAIESDFLEGPKIDFEVIRCDYPNIVPSKKYTVYSRQEPFEDPIEPEAKYTHVDLEVIDEIEKGIHKALLGAVIPNMRAITLKWKPGDKKAIAHFYNEGEIHLDRENYYASIAFEADPNYGSSPDLCGYEITRCDPPEKVPTHKDFMVYLRKEPFEDPS